MANIYLEKKKEYSETERSVNFAENENDKSTADRNVPRSNGILFKRDNFLGDYLKEERDDVVVGGYTPTVDDSLKLQKLLIENSSFPHPKENSIFPAQLPGETAIEEPDSIHVPLCIGLKTVENVVWPYSIFGQVNIAVQNERQRVEWCMCIMIDKAFTLVMHTFRKFSDTHTLV